MADTLPGRREYSRRALSPTNIEIVKAPVQKHHNPSTAAQGKVLEPFYVRNKVDIQNGGAIQNPLRQDPTVASRPVRGRMSSQENPQTQTAHTNNPYLQTTAEDRSKSAGVARPRMSKTDYLIQKMEDKNQKTKDLDTPTSAAKNLQGAGIAQSIAPRVIQKMPRY